jgi:hypothetical protein
MALGRNMKAIDVDTTMYVDSVKGDNSNDGLSWATAKKTIGGLPKEVNAQLTVMYRQGKNEGYVVEGMTGEGSVTIHNAFTPDLQQYLRLLEKQYIWKEFDSVLL